MESKINIFGTSFKFAEEIIPKYQESNQHDICLFVDENPEEDDDLTLSIELPEQEDDPLVFMALTKRQALFMAETINAFYGIK